MEIKILEDKFTVAKYKEMPKDLKGIYFTAVTDEEVSVLCQTEFLPEGEISKEGDMKGFRIAGELDFSLIGIISRITSILADNDVSVFVVSTFNTDYIFVREENLPIATQLLQMSGYDII